MTVKEFLAKIDPKESNWKTLSPGHWQNTATGAKYDTTDIVQAQINAYNTAQSAAGKPRFIPGVNAVPPGIQVTPGGAGGGKVPPVNGIITPPVTGGKPLPVNGIGNGGGPATGYIPGTQWNPAGPGTPGAAPTGAPGFGAPMKWNEQAGTGTGGPQRTGMAMPFSPYGSPEALSSEILRYGGKPNSGKGGYWSGMRNSPMQSAFTPKARAGGTSAGALDPFVFGGSDPAGQTLPGGGSYDTSGSTKEQIAARAKALMLQAQAKALREYLSGLGQGNAGTAVPTGPGLGGTGRA